MTRRSFLGVVVEWMSWQNPAQSGDEVATTRSPEEIALDRSPSLAGRAALAVVLMIGFYLLALGLAGLLLWIPYAEAVFINRVHLKLAIVCLLGAGIILWSVFPRADKFEPPGPALERESHPRLHALIDEVAQGTQQPAPAEVYLGIDVNAWVSSRGGVMGFGSRRVMGLGLPLLQTLSVSELRAVLAHEFGHYHGGDVALGPWIYTTRAAIGRTLQGLEQHSGLLQKPFEWYGGMFLRLTHAISRAQEFAADALAARVAGAGAMKSGLRRTHGAAMAYGAYWRNEFQPLLADGYRPPLAAGFQRFISSASIAQRISELTSEEEAQGESNIYDTHPALRDRLAMLDGLPETVGPVDDRPAITLFEDAAALERQLLEPLMGVEQAASLTDLRWEDVGSQVMIPRWNRLVEELRTPLANLTFAQLPERSKDLIAFAHTLPNVPRDAEPEMKKAYARWVLGALTAAALVRKGGTVRTLPGDSIFIVTSDGEVEPFAWTDELGKDGLDAETWRERCRRYGLAEEAIAP